MSERVDSVIFNDNEAFDGFLARNEKFDNNLSQKEFQTHGSISSRKNLETFQDSAHSNYNNHKVNYLCEDMSMYSTSMKYRGSRKQKAAIHEHPSIPTRRNSGSEANLDEQFSAKQRYFAG